MATRPAGAAVRFAILFVLAVVLLGLGSPGYAANDDDTSGDSWALDPPATEEPAETEPADTRADADPPQEPEWLPGPPADAGDAADGEGSQAPAPAPETEQSGAPAAEAEDPAENAVWSPDAPADEPTELPGDSDRAPVSQSSDGTNPIDALVASGPSASIPGAADESVTFELVAVDDSGVSGIATLTALGDGGVRIDLDIEEAPTGAFAALFSGSCAALSPDPNAILGQLGPDGVGQAELASVSLDELRGAYAVVVYAIGATGRQDLACGEVPAAETAVETARTDTSGVTSTGIGTTASRHAESPLLLSLAAIATILILVAIGLRRSDAYA